MCLVSLREARASASVRLYPSRKITFATLISFLSVSTIVCWHTRKQLEPDRPNEHELDIIQTPNRVALCLIKELGIYFAVLGSNVLRLSAQPFWFAASHLDRLFVRLHEAVRIQSSADLIISARNQKQTLRLSARAGYCADGRNGRSSSSSSNNNREEESVWKHELDIRALAGDSRQARLQLLGGASLKQWRCALTNLQRLRACSWFASETWFVSGVSRRIPKPCPY